MKWKKRFRFTAGLAISTPLVVAACDVSNRELISKLRDYDIGYAVSDITSLNYIKYESAVPFARSVVETLSKAAPSYRSALDSYMDSIRVLYLDTSQRNAMRQNSTTSGTLRTSSPKVTSPRFPGITCFGNDSDTFLFRLNGQSKWSNGDFLTPSNFIDAFVYVLDLNSGSQLINNFLKFGVKYATEFVSAQTAYSKKYNRLYQNPFGYVKNSEYDATSKHSTYWVQSQYDFPLQMYPKTRAQLASMPTLEKHDYLLKQRAEAKLVRQIAFYAKNLGIYGDLNSSHPYSHVAELTTAQIKGDASNPSFRGFSDSISYDGSNGEKIYPNVFQIKTALPFDSWSHVVGMLFRSFWLPVNRKFVESIGGVEKFGLSKTSFLTQGPFKLDRIILGRGGLVVLSKNTDYHDSKNTIPNKVKLYFQTDPLNTFSLFNDGYISATNLTALTAKNLYSDYKYRPLIRKSSGYGTTAFVFNTDPASPGFNPIIASENLRKAIFYATDRSDAIKLSGFDSTLPHYSLVDSNVTSGNAWLSNRGGIRALQRIGDSVYYDKYEPAQAKPLFPYKYDSYEQNILLVGNFDKTDLFKNKELAIRYFKEFLKEFPLPKNKLSHEIVYSYDSTKPALQIGISLQTTIKKTFGNKLVVKIKGYPQSVYDTYQQAGNFELSFRNLDYMADDYFGSGGVGSFFLQDGILKKEQKNTGFLKNPAGMWTFAQIVQNPVGQLTQREKDIKKRLRISNRIWNKIYELASLPTALKTKSHDYQTIFLNRRIEAFFQAAPFTIGTQTYPADPNFKANYNISELVRAANKLLLEGAPIVPLFVIDNVFEISRVVNIGFYKLWPSYDYAYDYKYAPIKSLPGYEALIN